METSLIIEAIDTRNSKDPNQIQADQGPVPAELIYGQRMSDWLCRLYAQPSQALQIAVRAQHIERWQVARSDFPEGRTGYLKWRTYLYSFHAERIGQLMQELDCNSNLTERVQFLVAKKKLFHDPETGALEDTACLVFLDHYFDDFIKEFNDTKIISIIQKTWGRMTEIGHMAALQLEKSEDIKELLQRALA